MVSEHIRVRDLAAGYGERRALRDISVDIAPNSICAVVGPAGSGKTTFVRCLNRTLELVPGAWQTGAVAIDGVDVATVRDVQSHRQRVGMVQPLPVGLPLSIYDNVAFAPRLRGITAKAELNEIVERSLRHAVLWDEVKDRLDMLGTRLSGGQQQRLTLARALSAAPTILCLDEFSIAIDPVTTMKIEEILVSLRATMTIVLVTNLVQQARRMADTMVFINDGAVVEAGPTAVMFDHAREPLTQRYLHGVIG